VEERGQRRDSREGADRNAARDERPGRAEEQREERRPQGAGRPGRGGPDQADEHRRRDI
jgi:hypothetical protein